MKRDRPNILLVNDNQDILGLVGTYLNLQGCRVLTAEDGRQGLELMQRCQVDVVFLNIMMPVMSGYDVLKVMESSEALRRLPVVMWTAKERPASLAEFNSFGIASLDWLRVPHELSSLTTVLCRSLGARWEWWSPGLVRPMMPGWAPIRSSRSRVPVAAALPEPMPEPVDLLDPRRPRLTDGWGDLRGEAELRRRELRSCLLSLFAGGVPLTLALWHYAPGLAKALGAAALLCCWHAFQRWRLAQAQSWRPGFAPRLMLILIALAGVGLIYCALKARLGS